MIVQLRTMSLGPGAATHAVAFALISLAAGAALPAASGAQVFTRLDVSPAGTAVNNSVGASWVDYDGDNDLDLFLSVRGGLPNALYRNNGGGGFQAVSAGVLTSVVSIGNSWADYDNDGDLDVCLSGTPSRLLRNDGPSGFTDRTGDLGAGGPVNGWACAWGDVDNDGHVDLVITHPVGFLGAVPNASNAYFHNRGDGTFERVLTGPVVTGLDTYTVPTWSDADDDGDLDLFIGSGPADGGLAPDNLYRNLLVEDGSAGFVRRTDHPLATDNLDGQVWNWNDLDNDGDLDAFVTNFWGGVPGGHPDRLFRNDGGTYVRITSGPLVQDRGFSLANVWGDFDNDGDLDVFVTNALASGPNRFYVNDGSGGFTRSVSTGATAHAGESWGAAAGDFDGDGDLDLFVSNTISSTPGGANFLYRNDTPAVHHWLQVALRGVQSNAAGIGARVRILASVGSAPVWQQREISSQNTFCGQNGFDAHFGLGAATVVDSVLVEWPSGTVDRLGGVPADQVLILNEGSSQPVPVRLLDLGTERTSEGVLVRWRAIPDAGEAPWFRLFRDVEGVRDPVAADPVFGAGSHEILDRNAPRGAAVHWLEERGLRGTIRWHGPLVTRAVPGRAGPEPGTWSSPNPFRAGTRIGFRLSGSAYVRLDVFDASGRSVTRLVNRRLPEGHHEADWNGMGADGRPTPPGVYFYRLEVDGSAHVHKLLRIAG